MKKKPWRAWALVDPEDYRTIVGAARAVGEPVGVYSVRAALLRTQLLRLVLAKRGKVQPCPLWDELPLSQLRQHVQICPACAAATTAVEDLDARRDIPDEWLEAWEMRLQGATVRQIARKFNVSPQTAHYWTTRVRRALLPWTKGRD